MGLEAWDLIVPLLEKAPEARQMVSLGREPQEYRTKKKTAPEGRQMFGDQDCGLGCSHNLSPLWGSILLLVLNLGLTPQAK